MILLSCSLIFYVNIYILIFVLCTLEIPILECGWTKIIFMIPHTLESSKLKMLINN